MLISCRNGMFDGDFHQYLNADLNQPCWNPTHMTAVIMIGVPTLIVWVVGMPLFIFVVLESHRREKHNDVVRFRFGMLMEGYEDDYFYWESVIASRKMMVIGVSVFMSSFTVELQAYAGIGVVILFMTMHISANPYNSKALDQMEKYALLTAFATLYIGLLFYISKQESEDNSILVIFGSLSIVAINVLYLIFAVIEILSYYAHTQQGKLHKCFVFFQPICNRLRCRSKKQRVRRRKLLHKITMIKKMKITSIMPAPEYKSVVANDTEEAKNWADWSNDSGATAGSATNNSMVKKTNESRVLNFGGGPLKKGRQGLKRKKTTRQELRDVRREYGTESKEYQTAIENMK
jgi:uncharacterized membrane protein YjfL (UPF0719 family)